MVRAAVRGAYGLAVLVNEIRSHDELAVVGRPAHALALRVEERHAQREEAQVGDDHLDVLGAAIVVVRGLGCVRARAAAQVHLRRRGRVARGG